MNAASNVTKLLQGQRNFTARPIETALRVGITLQTVFQQSQFERERDQALLGAVVEIALQPLPLLLPGLDHPLARPPKLHETSSELGVKPAVLERDRRRSTHGV